MPVRRVRVAVMASLRFSGRGWTTWRRPNVLSWRVSPAARWAARVICSASARMAGQSGLAGSLAASSSMNAA